MNADPDRPDWILGIDAAVWIVDVAGRITFLNAQARELLGIAPGVEPTSPCHAVVAGLDAAGAAICTESCLARAACEAGRPHRPLLLRRETGAAPGWILVLPVTLAVGGEARLAHVAVPMERYRRTAEYWERVLADSFPSPGETPPAPARVLSPREREVLARLARGHDLKRIARELFVSYTTVRNHVQHILEKLHVHSRDEAVALQLLLGDSDEPPRSSGTE